jgi:hypothetical protein
MANSTIRITIIIIVIIQMHSSFITHHKRHHSLQSFIIIIVINNMQFRTLAMLLRKRDVCDQLCQSANWNPRKTLASRLSQTARNCQ